MRLIRDTACPRTTESLARLRAPMLSASETGAPIAAIRDCAPVIWLGARMRNITGEGERSAYGLPDATGILVLEVPRESPLAKVGLRKGDVILSVDGRKVQDTAALLREPTAATIGISRDQREQHLSLRPPQP